MAHKYKINLLCFTKQSHMLRSESGTNVMKIIFKVTKQVARYTSVYLDVSFKHIICTVSCGRHHTIEQIKLDNELPKLIHNWTEDKNKDYYILLKLRITKISNYIRDYYLLFNQIINTGVEPGWAVILLVCTCKFKSYTFFIFDAVII